MNISIVLERGADFENFVIAAARGNIALRRSVPVGNKWRLSGGLKP